MFLLLVLYTDGSFLALETPKSLHNLQTFPKFVLRLPSVYLPKHSPCTIIYLTVSLNSNAKLSTLSQIYLTQEYLGYRALVLFPNVH